VAPSAGGGSITSLLFCFGRLTEIVFARGLSSRARAPSLCSVYDTCTALVVGSDDVASSYCMGVLRGAPGWQKGRKSGGSCSRQMLSWHAPISSTPEPAVTRLKMKSPDVNPGDHVIRDRRNKDIAHMNIHGEARRVDHEGGWRDHREGVYEGTLTRQSSRDRTPRQLCTE